MNRDDFPMLNQNIIYFDNGATTLKPSILATATSDYYNNYSANAHRGDYDVSLKVDTEYEKTRKMISKFINSKSEKEIVFTSGTTDSLNKIIFGYYKNVLKKDDEILVTKSEHASNILPWFELCDEIGCKIKYIELDDQLKLRIENVEKSITSNTRVISIAHVTNVVGDVRPIKEITKLAHENNIDVLVDGAQSVPHMKVDVQDLDIDFLAFSAHKMCGPTGIGILYGKHQLLKNIKPILFGGGMNASFSNDGTRIYNEVPYLLEGGTQNIAGVIGFGKVLEYLEKIGMDKIHEYEVSLKEYAISKLSKIPNVVIYNKTSESGIVTFNVNDIFSQDLAIYLNKHNICVRAGNHCAKILKDELKIKNTCRISFYFYNNFEEIDELSRVLENDNILEQII